MGYSSRQEVERILNQALTTATNNTDSAGDDSFVPLYEISNSTRPNAISPSLVDQYILWADEEIDSALSEMYAVPFCEKADLQMSLIHDIGVYSDNIDLDKARNLNPGDTIVFIDDFQEERHIVENVVNNNLVEIKGTLLGFYDSDNTRVIRVKYPPAITLASARMSAANIFDKYFTAEVSPNISNYGKHLRKVARGDLNNILNGRTILHGQKRIGHRFFNPNLRDRYRLPSAEQDSSRNLDDLD